MKSIDLRASARAYEARRQSAAIPSDRLVIKPPVPVKAGCLTWVVSSDDPAPEPAPEPVVAKVEPVAKPEKPAPAPERKPEPAPAPERKPEPEVPLYDGWVPSDTVPPDESNLPPEDLAMDPVPTQTYEKPPAPEPEPEPEVPLYDGWVPSDTVPPDESDLPPEDLAMDPVPPPWETVVAADEQTDEAPEAVGQKEDDMEEFDVDAARREWESHLADSLASEAVDEAPAEPVTADEAPAEPEPSDEQNPDEYAWQYGTVLPSAPDLGRIDPDELGAWVPQIGRWVSWVAPVRLLNRGIGKIEDAPLESARMFGVLTSKRLIVVVVDQRDVPLIAVGAPPVRESRDFLPERALALLEHRGGPALRLPADWDPKGCRWRDGVEVALTEAGESKDGKHAEGVAS